MAVEFEASAGATDAVFREGELTVVRTTPQVDTISELKEHSFLRETDELKASNRSPATARRPHLLIKADV